MVTRILNLAVYTLHGFLAGAAWMLPIKGNIYQGMLYGALIGHFLGIVVNIMDTSCTAAAQQMRKENVIFGCRLAITLFVYSAIAACIVCVLQVLFF